LLGAPSLRLNLLSPAKREGEGRERDGSVERSRAGGMARSAPALSFILSLSAARGERREPQPFPPITSPRRPVMPEDDNAQPVATGDRREEVHLERRNSGDLRAAHLDKPAALPPDLAAAEHAPPEPPVQDVAIAPDGPSAWDARPVDDGHEHPGKG
jgi:hypothetical protein